MRDRKKLRYCELHKGARDSLAMREAHSRVRHPQQAFPYRRLRRDAGIPRRGLATHGPGLNDYVTQRSLRQILTNNQSAIATTAKRNVNGRPAMIAVCTISADLKESTCRDMPMTQQNRRIIAARRNGLFGHDNSKPIVAEPTRRAPMICQYRCCFIHRRGPASAAFPPTSWRRYVEGSVRRSAARLRSRPS